MSRRRKHSKGRFIISSILSFLLAVLLTVATVVLAVKIGFINENRIISSLNYKDYYSGVEAQFYQDAKDLSTPMGIPESVLDGIVESDQIHEDIKGYVSACFQGKTYTFQTDKLEQNLTEHIYQYFQAQGWQMTQEQLETIPEYTKMISDRYVEDMKIPLVNHFHKIDRFYTKLTAIVLGVSVVLSAGIIFALIKMHRWKHRALRFVTYSTIAAAFMVAAPAVVVLVNGFYKRISIGMEYLYYAMVEYISGGFLVLIYMSFIWAVVSAILLLLIKYLKKHS